MPLRDLRYVILFVEDLERSLEFYLRKVGLEVRYRAEGYAELAVDGPKLALLERWRISEIVGSGEAQRPAPGAHEGEVAFVVEDVDAVYGELRARGVAFRLPAHRPTLEPADGLLQGPRRASLGNRPGAEACLARGALWP